jgi:hypothetical protein
LFSRFCKVKVRNDRIGMIRNREYEMLKNLTCFLITLLFLTSCQGFPFGSLFSPQATSPQNSGVLFADDFTDTNSGWDRQRSKDGITDYEDGQYLIQVDRVNYDFFANPSLSLADVRVEVEAANPGGEQDNEFGIICRFQNKNDFYAGLISSDGYYGIFKVKGGEYYLLGMEAMAKSAAIQTNSDKNLIRLDCKGQEIKLFVNGIQLDARRDADFVKGDVGLLAGAYQKSGVKIVFDNFVVLKP